MPLDTRDLPAGQPNQATADQPIRTQAVHRHAVQKPVAIWLFIVAGMIVVMVALGGLTRLTGSGLSIMEWAPLMGTLPPLSHAEWQRLFGLYQQIPQYALVNPDIGLEGFRQIFWLEWFHRLWGRLIGLVFLLPLIGFALAGRLNRPLLRRLVPLFLLGGLQGAIGWFMVASGFLPDATAVAPVRLVVHLSLALLLFSAVLWVGLGLWPSAVLRPAGDTQPPGGDRLSHGLALAATGLTSLTIIAGGFVAGTHAGLDYNTFPLMDGRIIPAGYAALHPFPRNLLENIATIQFDHRLLATLTLLACLATVAAGYRSMPRKPLLLVGAAVCLQYAIGVSTLLWVVPVGLAALHQIGATVLLTTLLILLHRTRRGGRRGYRS